MWLNLGDQIQQYFTRWYIKMRNANFIIKCLFDEQRNKVQRKGCNGSTINFFLDV